VTATFVPSWRLRPTAPPANNKKGQHDLGPKRLGGTRGRCVGRLIWVPRHHQHDNAADRKSNSRQHSRDGAFLELRRAARTVKVRPSTSSISAGPLP
jgi:hypothetical protein